MSTNNKPLTADDFTVGDMVEMKEEKGIGNISVELNNVKRHLPADTITIEEAEKILGKKIKG